jgi:NAD(P)-dependent dehydrogenase (short-subunit alcohol dehydrogenase family)
MYRNNPDSPSTIFDLDPSGFQSVFDLNFTGTLLPSQVFGEAMAKQGKGVILNISSMNSFRPLTKIPAYSAAKASVNNFTQWLAVHLAQSGVRVNAIAPGFFLTDQNRFLLTEKETGEPTPRGRKIIANTPMGKYGNPEHLQGAVLFLLSDLSEFITGVILPVDGGYSAFGGV